MVRILILCMAAGAVCAACAADIPFRKLCGGDDAVYGAKKVGSGPELALARDMDEMRRLWAENVTGAYRDAGGMPAVDWEKDFVVAVFLGARPSPGRGLRISGVALKEKALEITVLEDAPPSASPSTPARTASPYAMAACARAGVPLAEILMLRLVAADGGTLAERPAWSYHMLDASGGERTR